MEQKYSYLLFDLDGTLLDFLKSESVSIRAVFQQFDMPSDDATVQLYSKINDSYWKRFERGEIQREEIFTGRFETLLSRLQLKRSATEICNAYFKALSQSAYLIEGAIPLLDSLKENYVLCAATNGYALTQHNRLKISGLEPYFKHIFISEEMQTKKPDKRFFELAFAALGCTQPKKALMIGDSISSDIAGGIAAGCDTCYVNLNGRAEVPPLGTTYTVTSLAEIKSVCGL